MRLTAGSAEERAVLQLADHPLQALVGLQSHALRVLVADRAEIAAELAEGNDGAAEAAG